MNGVSGGFCCWVLTAGIPVSKGNGDRTQNQFLAHSAGLCLAPSGGRESHNRIQLRLTPFLGQSRKLPATRTGNGTSTNLGSGRPWPIG